jgi:hypothetical protein
MVYRGWVHFEFWCYRTGELGVISLPETTSTGFFTADNSPVSKLVIDHMLAIFPIYSESASGLGIQHAISENYYHHYF